MIATKILIIQRYLLPLPSRINNQLHRSPSQTPSVLPLWGKIIVCDSFTFSHLRKREWKKWGDFARSMCLCLHLSVLVVLTLPSTAFYLKSPKAKKKGESKFNRVFFVFRIMNFTKRQCVSRGCGCKGHSLKLFYQQGFVLLMFTVFTRQRLR